MKLKIGISFIIGIIIGILGFSLINNIVRTKFFSEIEKTLLKDEVIKDDSGWGENVIGIIKKDAKVTEVMKKGNVSYIRLNFILPSDSLK